VWGGSSNQDVVLNAQQVQLSDQMTKNMSDATGGVQASKSYTLTIANADGSKATGEFITRDNFAQVANEWANYSARSLSN
ncbi:hypothetical protein, partial [Snodgrassella sp. CFCC 13594]|uniref:hypothetical protein n=1 Tax=Snodgrassella sp. CFCC 13594 TaxID=1775559 RepID=UPI000AC3D075